MIHVQCPLLASRRPEPADVFFRGIPSRVLAVRLIFAPASLVAVLCPARRPGEYLGISATKLDRDPATLEFRATDQCNTTLQPLQIEVSNRHYRQELSGARCAVNDVVAGWGRASGMASAQSAGSSRHASDDQAFRLHLPTSDPSHQTVNNCAPPPSACQQLGCDISRPSFVIA